MAGLGTPDIQNLLSGPTAWGLATRLAVRHLEQAGIEVTPLLSQSGLSSEAIAARTRIRVEAQMQFLDLAARASNDAWLGLTLAKECDLREMGMLYYVASSSHRLGDAFKRLARHVRLGNEALVVRLKEKTAFSVEVAYAGVRRHKDRHQAELFMFVFLRLCRKLVGRDLSPQKVTFVHQKHGDVSRILRLFGCEVEYGAATDEIVFSAGTVDLSVVGADPFLNALMLDMCDEAMALRSSKSAPFALSWKTA